MFVVLVVNGVGAWFCGHKLIQFRWKRNESSSAMSSPLLVEARVKAVLSAVQLDQSFSQELVKFTSLQRNLMKLDDDAATGSTTMSASDTLQKREREVFMVGSGFSIITVARQHPTISKSFHTCSMSSICMHGPCKRFHLLPFSMSSSLATCSHTAETGICACST